MWEEHFPDEEEKLLKNFFLKSASETCRAKLGEEFAKTRAEIDSLHVVNKDLLERQEKLVDILDETELKQSEVEEIILNIEQSKQVLDELKPVLDTDITKNEVDSLVETPIPLDAAILEATVADEAVKDCIYALGRALSNDKISVETYLKKVRELSRKQFHTRHKIKYLESVKFNRKND